MLFNPHVLVERPWAVLATLAVIVGGNGLAAFGAARLLGQSTATARTVAANLVRLPSSRSSTEQLSRWRTELVHRMRLFILPKEPRVGVYAVRMRCDGRPMFTGAREGSLACGAGDRLPRGSLPMQRAARGGLSPRRDCASRGSTGRAAPKSSSRYVSVFFVHLHAIIQIYGMPDALDGSE